MYISISSQPFLSALNVSDQPHLSLK